MAIKVIDRASNICGRFTWSSRAEAINNVRTALFEKRPQLARKIVAVEQGHITDETVIETIRDRLYILDTRELKGWGIGKVFNPDCRQLDHTLFGVLNASFPKLKLNRYGFMIMWDRLSFDEACAAVKYRIFKHRPDIAALAQDATRREELKAALYQLDGGNFSAFGLGSTIRGRGIKQFGGHLTAAEMIIRVFPELHLERFLFWGRTFKDIFEAEVAVRTVLFKKYPELGKMYASAKEAIALGRPLPDSLFPKMKRIVTRIRHEEFQARSLRYFLNAKRFPAFKGSFRQVLIRSFSLLEIKEEDFLRTRRWRSREEAIQNIRQAVFSSQPQLKKDYLALTALRCAGKKDERMLAERLGYRLMGISRKKLKRLKINLTSRGGAVKLFHGSKTRAFQLAFPLINHAELRAEFKAKHYNMQAIFLILDCFERFERISSGDFEITPEDWAYLRNLTSAEFLEGLKRIAGAIPRPFLLRIVNIHATQAPQFLKLIDKT